MTPSPHDVPRVSVSAGGVLLAGPGPGTARAAAPSLGGQILAAASGDLAPEILARIVPPTCLFTLDHLDVTGP
ncbi:hypothetical protein [Nonomuraea guangzhouensis]|uniref:Uncharacterized protein n=1 Tax=Nonomuraea guangzhouensis TaxID=1291555 RepID=A0ABW4GU42_9ACTN|nr:hypothetical protein [Nonomuraea guangzhouensis]